MYLNIFKQEKIEMYKNNSVQDSIYFFCINLLNE